MRNWFLNDKIPKVFVDLIAHVESYRGTIAGWKETDFNNCQNNVSSVETCPALAAKVNTAVNNYPAYIEKCVDGDYRQLITARDRLFGAPLTLSLPPISTSCPEPGGPVTGD
jgi:hypothetical protein